MNLKAKNKLKNKPVNNTSNEKPSAKAPYNFVSLNDFIVAYEFDEKENKKEIKIPPFNSFKEEFKNKRLYSGYIDLEITNETPLYIGSDEKGIFFGTCINRVPVIPGSSLRGMTRTLVEIMSFSKMKFVDRDRRLFYRSFGEMSLRGQYQELIKNSYPCLIKYDEERDIFLIAKEGVKDEKKEDTSKEFTIEKIGEWKWIIYSGKIQNKKHNWLVKVQVPEKLEWKILPKEDIILYKSDKTRKTDLDIIEKAKNEKGSPVPCFYIEMEFDGKKHIILGHTKNFRIPYKLAIKDYIPDSHKVDSKLDIAEAIFGVESKFASRVYFEDAVAVDGYEFLGKTSPKILSTPKPTCFQHYLEQEDPANLKTWNDRDTKIRGFKLYWHRITPDDPKAKYSWNEGKEIDDTQHTVINPIKPGAKFKGRIRFVNLTEVELGALLYALDLGEKYRHKIGMGKPLGFGSIKITPTLYLIKRKERYSKLFDKDQWFAGFLEIDSFDEFKKKFKEYVQQKLKEQGYDCENYDSIKRIKQLLAMLEWDENKYKEEAWLEFTRYMQIKYDIEERQGKRITNEYKGRPILPEPLKVKRE